MNQVGYVRKIDNSMAILEVRRVSSCGDNCSSCGSSCDIPSTKVKVKNTLMAKEGDFVEVKMKTNVILQSAFLVYIMPLIMMIVGISFGISIFKNMGISSYESLGFLMGIIALIISFFILRIIDKKIRNSSKLEFQMIRII